MAAMNLDQRNDDQPIRSGELPVVARPSEDLSDLPADDEFEEAPFSKWILPISLFVATIFTTLWAGAYQAYDGPIHGPVNFLLEHPETLWRGIPFAATLLIILVTHEFGHYVLSASTEFRRRCRCSSRALRISSAHSGRSFACAGRS